VYDYFDALSARCDSIPPSAFCSVWGATEGPAGDLWNYRSRDVYLWSSLAFNLLFVSGILAPFFVPSHRTGFAAMLGIVIFGSLGLAWLGPLVVHGISN
jgi:hypothetical protein